MNAIWTGRIAQATGTYAEHAPMATACCNACRACATTNILSVAFAAAAGAGYALSRAARRLLHPKP